MKFFYNLAARTRIISSSNYREIDIKYINLKNYYLQFFFSIKHKFGVHKRNISRRYRVIAFCKVGH